MAKCANNNHRWILMFVAPKTWVVCEMCSDRFPFSHEQNGARYGGPVPVKYQRVRHE